ncbi:T9SS type A sorting domain-containing protein [Rasiella rasia]|uniref:T9SS type A sorting domain-containing protein n=1 Tax=Rasiella rasia TaxID=2744027 RepID=A0A6G6GQ68_9FLAO|nr:GEVED domain-containing protein [Rasiella rasia]QIE60745.1 T9SS type A sorting domain-containing protein [Rasiella rasia]
MRKNFFITLLCAFAVATTFAQQQTYPPEEIIVGTFIGETMPLRDFAELPTPMIVDLENPIMIPNASITPTEENTTTTNIQNVQTENGRINVLPLEQNFIGASNNESGFAPPDPSGAVGPNHYLHAVNSIVKIFDKSGNLQVGPVSLSSFLGIPSNSGDPIIMYDQLADRWVVSEFGSINGGDSLAIGVSTSSDPGGTYNVYQYAFSSLPDYPKYSVWHDGYYGTVNLGGFTTRGFVMERDVMLAGGASPQILIFSLPDVVVNPNQVKSPVAANLLGTTIDNTLPGYIVYLQDDAWGGVSFDHLKVWEIDMDWGNTANSTISSPLEIATDDFDAGELFGNGNGALRQPGTSQRLAAHGGIISYSANYRPFSGHNSWLITFNTFIDAAETGGIRWIELRNDAINDWDIFQEGTFSIADGHSRVMSSSAMDQNGNIALAYTTGSTTLAPSLRYTGRFDGDPLGQMTVAETVIIDGPGVRNNFHRYGDYSHMTMDPDNLTFWFTSDYFASNNFWRTQVASFSLSSQLVSDVGTVDITSPESGILTATESVQVTIRNFGTATQTSIPLELRLDGNLEAIETFVGNIPSNGTATYTFAQTLDLSTFGQEYEIEVSTGLVGDEFANNDSFTKTVKHLFSDDVGTLDITAPVSGPGIGMAPISVVLKNFGADAQSNFDVQYTINGGTPVVQTFTATLDSEEEAPFTFDVEGDFTALGTYDIEVSTSLVGDLDSSNDTASVTIENVLCMPSLDCSQGDGFQLVSVAEINNASGCEGYADFTAQVGNLAAGSTNDITFTTGFGDQNVKVWIDYNDDFNFTAAETVVANFVMAPGQGAGSYTETVSLVVPASAAPGQHIMRVKSRRGGSVPNPCDDTQQGETEDYTINIGPLGVNDFAISNSDLIVTTLENNQFEVTLNTSFDGSVYLGVYNVLGQVVGFNKKVNKEGNQYKMKLDMSNVASGVYLIKMGGISTTSAKTARIIVK